MEGGGLGEHCQQQSNPCSIEMAPKGWAVTCVRGFGELRLGCLRHPQASANLHTSRQFLCVFQHRCHTAAWRAAWGEWLQPAALCSVLSAVLACVAPLPALLLPGLLAS